MTRLLIAAAATTAAPIVNEAAIAHKRLDELEWRGIPLASLVMGLLAIWLVREIVAARSNEREQGHRLLTGFLMLLFFAVTITWKPTPMLAMLVAGILGASGFAVIGVLQDKFPQLFDIMFGNATRGIAIRPEEDRDDDEDCDPPYPRPRPRPGGYGRPGRRPGPYVPPEVRDEPEDRDDGPLELNDRVDDEPRPGGGVDSPEDEAGGDFPIDDRDGRF